MSVTTVSSREFNHHIARAKRAAKAGPVIITDRGRPALVLLSAEEYEKLTAKPESLADALRMPDGAPEFDFDFEPERPIASSRQVEFD